MGTHPIFESDFDCLTEDITRKKMTVFHDEIEIEDMEFDEENQLYHYPCPCGDRFEISLEDLQIGEEVATCPSCSLLIRVIYDQDQFADYESDEEVTNLAQAVEAI